MYKPGKMWYYKVRLSYHTKNNKQRRATSLRVLANSHDSACQIGNDHIATALNGEAIRTLQR